MKAEFLTARKRWETFNKETYNIEVANPLGSIILKIQINILSITSVRESHVDENVQRYQDAFNKIVAKSFNVTPQRDESRIFDSKK